MNWVLVVTIAALVAQIIIAVVSYFTIYRHRSIYSIKTAVLRMPHGIDSDRHALETDQIDKMLESGKYTILQIVERAADKDLEIVMGQIKK
jgi:hypothetical protein